ncbi:outer membrane protein transport protein [Pseudoxanthomonas sp. X-1]|uniref:outer membrane protein transport protein n=1 Tax=Pseudoxanthomonas sp. X-1 TaxID=2571115 RepID=UPI00110B1D69|nr:outer membrane protein transport protein [Pseudoxanthomonas sp. X-1]TMN17215.1 transporter [Pseudoxanthomonas sp. X-1]UAY74401.1 outer membrane protein transport protein [Pseudoxanthomonas sp. X-1]
MLNKKNALAITVGAICAAASGAGFASALDRSGQSIAPFLKPGNYAEYGGSFLNPKVDGKDKNGTDTGNVANSYNFVGGAIKFQATDKFSFGFIYDEPFGASAEYHGANAFTANPRDVVLSGLPIVTGPSVISNGQLAAYGLNAGITGDTDVEVRTKSLSALLGFQPTENWNLYAGGVYQEIKGQVSLRGSTYSAFNGYDLSIPSKRDWGWLAGVAYQKPEIALQVSLTYRSEIDYDINANESMPLVTALGANRAQLAGLIQQLVLAGRIPPATGQALAGTLGSLGGLGGGTTSITTPQSVNLDFQTGIMADTVLFGNVRWVQWSKFAVRPAQFGQLAEAVGPLIGKPDGFNLVDYSKDQWSANLGLGRKLTDTVSGSFSVGWDGGAGNPVTTLGPTDGYWNVGLGLRYSPTPKIDLSAGVKYFWLGDATAETGAHSYAGDFKDNSAMAVGVKMGLHF